MESWQGMHNLTDDPSMWVNLMNLSTIDWQIGFFPFNVSAVNGSLNDSLSFNENNYVITHASKNGHGTRLVEPILLGLVPAAVLIVFILRTCCCLSEASSWRLTDDSEHHSGDGGVELESLGHSRDSRRRGERRGHNAEDKLFWQPYDLFLVLQREYYRTEVSMAQVESKDYATEGFEPIDVEEVATLLRRLYAIDSSSYTAQHSQEDETGDSRAIRRSILEKLKLTLDEWNKYMDSVEEREEDLIKEKNLVKKIQKALTKEPLERENNLPLRDRVRGGT